jgi:hypothetical protein
VVRKCFTKVTFCRLQRFSHCDLTGGNFNALARIEQVITTIPACQPHCAACAAQDSAIFPPFQPYQFALRKTTFHDKFSFLLVILSHYSALRHKNRYK